MRTTIRSGLGFVLAVSMVISAAAQDRGKVPGAIWKYDMSRVASPEVARKGAFRIDGTDIYQPREKKPKKIGTIEGKKNQAPQKGDKVKVRFETLRGSDRKELKCGGPITWDSLGEVHGRLIDSDGVHWNFKASRVQE